MKHSEISNQCNKLVRKTEPFRFLRPFNQIKNKPIHSTKKSQTIEGVMNFRAINVFYVRLPHLELLKGGKGVNNENVVKIYVDDLTVTAVYLLFSIARI